MVQLIALQVSTADMSYYRGDEDQSGRRDSMGDTSLEVLTASKHSLAAILLCLVA